MGDLLNLVNSLRAGDLNFTEFIGGLGQWFNDIGVGGKVTAFMQQPWFPILAFVVGFSLLFYGRKWFGLVKFASCGGMGFIVGLVVNPMIVGTIPYLQGKAWITGAICALILAVLNRLIFVLIFLGIPAALAFAVFYFKDIIPINNPLEGNALMCLIPAAGAIVLMLLLHRDLERIVTSLLGGFVLNLAIKSIYDYTASMPEHAMKIDLAAIAAITLIGFIYQYRRRRRYY